MNQRKDNRFQMFTKQATLEIFCACEQRVEKTVPAIKFCQRGEFYTIKGRSAVTFFSIQTICSQALFPKWESRSTEIRL